MAKAHAKAQRRKGFAKKSFDGLIAKQRANEPRESLSAVKKRLRRLGKLNG